jgi:OPA family glycerol-3-phosphate transporter-like MFS transporter
MAGTTDRSTSESSPGSADAARLARWQSLTLITLLVGYAGYYVCRSNLSVAAKPFAADFGLSKDAIGNIVSWGLLFYALGKIFAGMACDFVGGRLVFLFGMFASVACTLLFAAAPSSLTGSLMIAFFVVVWSLNRLVQSPGWGALVKVSSRWFPVERHGRMMAILCLSYLFGDVVARAFLGELLTLGLGWRGLFFASAGTLAAIGLASWMLLKPSPASLGLPEPLANPDNVFGKNGEVERPTDLLELLLPFFLSPAFWAICVMSVGLTLIREAVSFWMPTYLVEATSLSVGDSGKLSAVFPLFGGVSALWAGHAADRFVGQSRARVMVPLLALLTVPLLLLGLLPAQGGAAVRLVCFCVAAFLLMGPYTFLTGVLALDFGGKRGSATAAGLVDGAGYLGAVAAVRFSGRAADAFGWRPVFLAAAVIAALTACAAAAYWVLDEMHRRHRAAVSSSDPLPTSSATAPIAVDLSE